MTIAELLLLLFVVVPAVGFVLSLIVGLLSAVVRAARGRR